MLSRLLVGVLASAGVCLGFAPSTPSLNSISRVSARRSCASVSMQASSPVPFAAKSRRDALAILAGGAAWLANGKFANAVAGPEGLEYEVIKTGKGPKPKIGDLVAIRFKASYNGKEFDNCFTTQNAYYYRVGSETILRGLDLAVQNMRVGDQWKLVVPPSLAFGDKGVKASAGKPKIPGGATIEYEVLFETFPGAEDEILEVTGGDPTPAAATP